LVSCANNSKGEIMAKVKKAAVKEAVEVEYPVEEKLRLDGGLLLRITCKRKMKNNKVPAPGDPPDAMYDPCNGIFESPVSDMAAKSEKFFTCPKCKAELSGGMRATFGGDRIGILASVLNSAVFAATARGSLYVAEIIKITPAMQEAMDAAKAAKAV
jgi:hypothetical protein